MAIHAFDPWLAKGERSKPRIQILEVRHRDRPGEPPLARLVVERDEARVMYPDGSPRSASIELRYELIGGSPPFNKGCFCGGWRRGHGEADQVSITAPNCGGGFVTLDLQDLEGQRIGSYLMNEIVAWVKQWPEAIVNSVTLLPGQGQGANKERRNRFYEQFGLVFDYEDPGTRVAGTSRPMPAAGLRPVETWRANIEELDVRALIADLIRQNESLSHQLKWSRHEEREALERLDAARRHPIFWTVCQLWDNTVARLKF